MVAINSLSAGDVVYDVSREKMGNTSLRREAVRAVRTVSVNAEKQTVVASWNGNAEKVFRSRDIARWRRNKPPEKVSAFDRAMALARPS